MVPMPHGASGVLSQARWLHSQGTGSATQSSSRTRGAFPALRWTLWGLRLGGSGARSLPGVLSPSSSSSSCPGSCSSSLASAHSWEEGGVWPHQSSVRLPLIPQEDQPPSPAPPHLFPVLRCPSVPQRQGAAPSTRHSPHAMRVLHARAEGHKTPTARANLGLGAQAGSAPGTEWAAPGPASAVSVTSRPLTEGLTGGPRETGLHVVTRNGPPRSEELESELGAGQRGT